MPQHPVSRLTEGTPSQRSTSPASRALDRSVAELLPELRVVARVRLVHLSALADEVVHDAFVSVLRRKGLPEDPAARRDLLRAAVTKCALRRLRAEGRRLKHIDYGHERPAGEALPEAPFHADTEALCDVSNPRLRAALCALDPGDLAALVGLVIERRDAPSIAQELGVTPRAVRYRCQRALDLLRRATINRRVSIPTSLRPACGE